MPDSLVIRLASAADASAIEAVETRADEKLAALLGTEPFEAEEALVRLSMPGFLLVAERDDELVGFVHVVEEDGEALMEQLAVAVPRTGIGRSLVTAAAEQARARGASVLHVRTFADVGASPAFHAACGFTVAEPQSTFAYEIVAAEIELGLDDLAPRQWMTLPL